jgi:ABC-type branched-subunit amino acid transport system ATPase component
VEHNNNFILETRDIEVSFSGVPVLRSVDLRIAAGSICGIVGPNGAGKTTMFNVLAGLLHPDRGSVYFNGEDITALTPARRARAGIARTFQLSRELGSLTLLENLLLASFDQPGESLANVFFSPSSIHRAEEAAIDKAMALLKRARLDGLADQMAGTLSGGQKKLLELCRALMMEPRLILLDEPAAGVNPLLARELAEYIATLRDQGLTFALVEHNMELVSNLCDWVYVLVDGRIIKEGAFYFVASDETVLESYIGGLGV